MCGICIKKKLQKNKFVKKEKKIFIANILVIKKVNEINDSLALTTPDSDKRWDNRTCFTVDLFAGLLYKNHKVRLYNLIIKAWNMFFVRLVNCS